MQYYGQSDTGNVRKVNEDSFYAQEISSSLFAAVLADGMGGHTGGKEASSFVVSAVIKAIHDASKYFSGYTDRQIENFLKNTVIKINKNLYQKATQSKELLGMGTTLVICIIYNGKYYVANVGDSRLYLSSDDFTQITKDHSFVSELLDMGMITHEQALTHPNKNVITRAVGTEQTITADIFKGRLKDNDTILICSDGLTNMVTDDIISKVLTSTDSAEVITNNLISLAKENGGSDNITVITIKNKIGGDTLQ